MTEAPQFRVGDQVRVRLPMAPVMVVHQVDYIGCQEYLCVWFDVQARRHRADFDARVLELVEAAGSGAAG